MSITRPGVANRKELYRGFEITWQDPPLTGAAWTANIASEDRRLFQVLGSSGSKVVQMPTFDEMLASARASIDILLSHHGLT